MVEVRPVDARIVERKTIVYRTLVDPTVAKMTGEKMKGELFVRFGFLKPKLEQVEFVSLDKYYEPHMVVSGKYSIDYYRKRVYTIEVDGDVREVILLKQTFKPIPPKKKAAKQALNVIRLVGEERLFYEDKAYLVLDKKGREVAPEQVPQAPSEEEPDKILAEFGEKISKLELPTDMEVNVLRSKIVKRPSDIARVVKEMFEVSERAIIYSPIYEVRFQNTRTGEVKAFKINGVTANVLS